MFRIIKNYLYFSINNHFMQKVFKYKNWIEVFIGVYKDWLDFSSLTNKWDNNSIQILHNERYFELYWAEKKSKEDVLKLLSKYIYDDYQIDMIYEGDENFLELLKYDKFRLGFKIWEHFFLSEIKESKKNINQKLEEDIYYLWMDFKYFGVDWSDFIYLAAFSKKLTENDLYSNFENYFDDLEAFLFSR